MRIKITIATVCLLVVLAGGCSSSKSCSVTSYGPGYMTYTGNGEAFNNACRIVMMDIGYSEKNDDGSSTHPHSGEGASSFSSNDKAVARKTYFKNKDAKGYVYSITTVKLDGKDPVVTIETTNPDKYVLINALYKQFHEKGIKVSVK